MLLGAIPWTAKMTLAVYEELNSQVSLFLQLHSCLSLQLLELCDKIRSAPESVKDQTLNELVDLRKKYITEVGKQ